MKKAGLLCLLVLLVVVMQGGAAPESYPSKFIKVIVPYPAGGPADQRSRQLAERLRRALGQPVVVENKPGAGGG